MGRSRASVPSLHRQDASAERVSGTPCTDLPMCGPRLAPINQDNAFFNRSIQGPGSAAGTIIFERTSVNSMELSYAGWPEHGPLRLAPIIGPGADSSALQKSPAIGPPRHTLPLSDSDAAKAAIGADLASADIIGKRLRSRRPLSQDDGNIMTQPPETPHCEQSLQSSVAVKTVARLKRSRVSVSMSTDVIEKERIEAAEHFLIQLMVRNNKERPKRRRCIRSSKDKLEKYLASANGSRPSKDMQLVMHLLLGGWQWPHIESACRKVFGEPFNYASLRATFHRLRLTDSAVDRAVYKTS